VLDMNRQKQSFM